MPEATTKEAVSSASMAGNVHSFPLMGPCSSMDSPSGMNMSSDKQQPGASMFGDNLLREYAVQTDPLNTNGDTHSDSGTDEAPQSSLSRASTEVDSSPQDTAMSLPSSPLFSLRAPKSFLSHRKGAYSIDSMPHQSILKALVSRPSKNGIPPVSIAASLASLLNTPNERDPRRPASQHLSASPMDFNTTLKTPSTARFTSVQSPCFFHQRFDDAVNIDRVLEEIAAEDDGMSHGRLMQTATSVREISKQLQRRPIRRAVRTVMIVTKARDNSLVYLTRELAEWLLSTSRYNSDLGVNVYVDAKLRTSKRFNADSLIASNPRYESMLHYWTPDLCWSSPEKFDLVLTLGGDGTVLYTSWLFQRIVPPILSFSLGSLGFLTNFEFAAYKPSLDRVMGEAGMRVNLRMRFTCTVYRANLNRSRHGDKKGGVDPTNTAEMVEGEQFEVLNELCIDRGPSPYVSNLELYGDNELLTVVQADGCIFSTPTGSTAYSLSAGGPLTHPSIPGILLTPICPHTLSFRPMVLSDSLLLKVCVPRNSRSTAYASFDGKGRVELRRGDCVQVEAGRYPFPTVVGEGGTGGEWFESVRRALRWNTRGAVQKGFNTGKGASSGKVEKAGGEEEDGRDGWKNHGDDMNREEEDDDDNGGEGEDEDWDINPDPIDVGYTPPDSGIGPSEESGSTCASPPRKLGSFALY
ncbi:NAD(+) kinase [Lignoscripta atroalba]|nr:NAD(+) kinase [Lignoscripta atroalba]